MKKYIPAPVDTSKVEVDKTLNNLLEKLAHNTHDVWALGRQNDGWVYGVKRDDSKKLHPCLVPYDELPESEKEYDRQTALETLKLVIELGYRISPPESLSVSDHEAIENKQLLASIKNKNLSLSELINVWSAHNKIRWQSHPEIYYQTGIRFLQAGEALFAYDVFSEGLECFPVPDVLDKNKKNLFIKMSQQKALALTETGAVAESADILRQLSEFSDSIENETFGILGRIYKEMGLCDEIDENEKIDYLNRSFDYYFSAYKNALNNNNDDDGYYNGINAATVALFKGDKKQTQSIALQVTRICQNVIEECKKNSKDIMYWVYATLGEAELLMGNIDTAKSYYLLAMDKMSNDMRGRISMHKQATKILEYLQIKGHSLEQVFKPPTILVFSGHMIDEPVRSLKRFPAEFEQQVAEQIRKQLEQYNTCIAYSSAACGADIIFLEEVLNKGGEINIILPFDAESFNRHSIDKIPDADWGGRFDFLISKASRVIILTQFAENIESPAYDFSNRFIYGVAIARSKIIDSKIEYLSVWDGIRNDKPGGTSSVIDLWLRNKNSVTCISPSGSVKNISDTESISSKVTIQHRFTCNDADVSYYNYLPLLFADVKGYSKLNEQQLVSFSTIFLKLVREVCDKHSEGTLAQRTQGDGLFIVFNSLQVAASFAGDVNKMINCTQWEDYGLPDDLTIRISLDAGPCYSYIEPVTGNLEFCGDYVNRAARMEPITPPGHIYASETFVALANVENLTGFKFVYAGQVVLPKGHGIIPAYHLYSN